MPTLYPDLPHDPTPREPDIALDRIPISPTGIVVLPHGIAVENINALIGHARVVIPPYWLDDEERSARAALAVKASNYGQAGIVIVGENDHHQEAYFLWAIAQKYSPIVFSSSYNRGSLANNLYLAGTLNPGWYHIEGTRPDDPADWPGCSNWTFSEAFDVD